MSLCLGSLISNIPVEMKTKEPVTTTAKKKKEKVVSFQTVKKKTPVTIPLDESKSFGEILSRFEEKILNLRMIMDWPVTSKPYTIAIEDGKVRSNSKSLF